MLDQLLLSPIPIDKQKTQQPAVVTSQPVGLLPIQQQMHFHLKQQKLRIIT